MASTALAQTRAAGLKPNVVFVPRPSASPAQLAAAKDGGAVTPLYTGTPAPMGLGYFGLSSGPGGQVVPTELNTTAVQATVDFNGTGVQAADLFQSSPDSYGIQLNSVVTNVTLFGTPGYSFWTQNVVEYYPATDFLVLITNVWNFSGGPLTANVFYSHGPFGTQVGTEYYYAEYVIESPVAYPFNITLTLNSGISTGRNIVDFSVGLVSTAYPTESFSLPNWDYVVFNSLAAHTAPLVTPSPYTANGYAYNPIGLTDDFELIFGGPGGGSQSTLFDADATLGLAYWNGAAFVSVPAAFNYGGETGETVIGANIAWSNAPGGPAGLPEYGTMTTGPSILTGLWNAGTPQGSYPVTLLTTPANAFNILAPVGWSANFTVNEAGIAPQGFTNTYYLAPGNYSLLTELSGYLPISQPLDVTGPIVLPLPLAPDPLIGVYTPLWAFNNAEIAALSTGGLGTAGSPYVMPTAQPAPFAPIFGAYNDYTFPAWPGVFFLDTSAYTVFDNASSLNTTTNDFAFPGPNLPAFNDLQFWFWNASNVALVNSTISGWFGQYAWYPAVFDTFNVIFYEGGNNLVAGNVFASQGQDLLDFSGGTIFGPYLNIGGGNSTIWGNVFTEGAPPPACPAAPMCESLLAPVLGLGLEVASNGNLIYNNEFLTPTTAWELPLNLYSGDPEFFSNSWNIAPVPGSVVNFAAGFPWYPLTGVILEPSFINGHVWQADYQGGNYWWDYGLPTNPYFGEFNPFGLLPYDENGSTLLFEVYGPFYYYASWIYPGGDYAPIVPFTLWTVTFHEVGLPSGANWDIVLDNFGSLFQNFTTDLTSYPVQLPNGIGGEYSFTVSAPYGYTAIPSSSPNLNINNHNGTVVITFVKTTYSVSFVESGLTAKQLAKGWSVQFNGTEHTVTTRSITFIVMNGSYPYLVSGPSGYRAIGPNPAAGTVVVAGVNQSLPYQFEKGATYTLSFSISGLAKGTNWCVLVQGSKVCSTKGSIKLTDLTPGDYAYTVESVAGYTLTAKAPYSLSGTVVITTKSVTVGLKATKT